MNTPREIAYRHRSGAVGARSFGRDADALAGDVSARATRGIHSCADGAASRQDHHGGLGDCAFHAFYAGSLSVIACPAQRQSAEAVRRVRETLIKAGAELESDNVYGLELKNGSRVLALPGSDDSIRGLTVDGWIVADEAARLPDDLIAALRPMRARRPQARFAMLSTAWSRTDPFWTAWAGDEQSWLRLKATADEIETFSPEFLEQERRALGEEGFKREYLGIPSGGQVSPFIWELYERATHIHMPLVPPGPAFAPPFRSQPCPLPIRSKVSNQWEVPMTFNRDDASTWPCFRPLIIAHDVGRSRDRSTAVVGGNSPFEPRLLGIQRVRRAAARTLWQCARQRAGGDRSPLQQQCSDRRRSQQRRNLCRGAVRHVWLRG